MEQPAASKRRDFLESSSGDIRMALLGLRDCQQNIESIYEYRRL